MSSVASNLKNATLVLSHATVEGTLSRWRRNKTEINDQQCIQSLSASETQPPKPSCEKPPLDNTMICGEYDLWRVFYCKENDMTEHEKRLLHDFSVEKSTTDASAGQKDSLNINFEVKGLAFGAWRELNRNVPSHLQFTDANQAPRFVAVARRKSPWRGPIIVLVGLKYGGNVGSIIRSAVQANVFQAVYIVEERGSRTETTPLFTKTWGCSDTKKINDNVNNTSISDKDISYYSMWNAPLIEIRRFQTMDHFLRIMEDDDRSNDIRRSIVCLDIGPKSFSLYSKEVIRLFQSSGGKAMYLVIGAEDTGLPQNIVSRATALIEIPAMSASINVSNAFAACLSTFMLCNSGALDI